MLARLQPANVQAEQAILGAILANNKAYDLCGTLKAEHFYEEVNRLLFEALERRIQAGQLVDCCILLPWVESVGICSSTYLAQLLTAMVGIWNVKEYAKTVQDLALRRRILAVLESGITETHTADIGITSAQAIIGRLESSIIMSGCTNSHTVGEATMLAMERADKAAKGTGGAIYCGLPSVDDQWGGIFPQSLDLIGGLSGSGKTGLMLQFARAIAGAGHHVGIGSMEVSAPDAGTMNLSALSGLSADLIRSGKLGLDGFEKLTVAHKELSELPITIVDDPLTLGDAISHLRTWKRQFNCKVGMFDHRDWFRRDKGWEKAPALDWFHHVTLSLKAAAKSLDMSIILLVQLTKAAADAEDRRPRVSHIRYAGEKEADNILLIHRPYLTMGEFPPKRPDQSQEWYANARSAFYREKESLKDVAELIFGKRRFGPQSSVPLVFDGPRFTFREPFA